MSLLYEYSPHSISILVAILVLFDSSYRNESRKKEKKRKELFLGFFKIEISSFKQEKDDSDDSSNYQANDNDDPGDSTAWLLLNLFFTGDSKCWKSRCYCFIEKQRIIFTDKHCTKWLPWFFMISEKSDFLLIDVLGCKPCFFDGKLNHEFTDICIIDICIDF